MKHPHLTIGLGALGAITLGLLLMRKQDLSQVPPLQLPKDPLSIPPSSGPVKLTAHLSDVFFRDVERMTEEWRSKGSLVTSEDVVATLLAESDVKPWIANKIGCAGMNQICVLGNVGWTGTRSQYLALSAQEQLPWVKRYFDQSVSRFAKGDYRSLSSRGKLYLMNFSPAFINQPESFVMYRRDPNGPLTTASLSEWSVWTKEHSKPPNVDAYALNRSVDFGNKGYIEVADMKRFVDRATSGKSVYWAELRMRIDKARRQGNV